MRLKRSAVLDGVQPELFYAMGAVDAITYVLTGKRAVFTCLRDSHENSPNSLHNAGAACDCRVSHLTLAERHDILIKVRELLEKQAFDVVSSDNADPAVAAQHANHEHVEFDPKPGESFVAYVD